MNEHPKILVVGDLIVDEYVYGECHRISQEAPVPIVSYTNTEMRMGGAANVAANLRDLGAQVMLWGGEKKSIKTRVVVGNQQICRIDRDDTTTVEPTHELVEFAKSADAIVVSDYCKGAVNTQVLDAISKTAYGKPVLVDPYNGRCTYNIGIKVIKPNRKETESVTGIKINGTDSLIKAGQSYLAQSNAENVVITLGAEGMALFDNGKYHEKPFAVKSEAPQQVFDVTGAGDTVIAVLAYIWASGGDGKFSKQTAVTFANKAAGIACSKFGTATVNHKELFGEWLGK